MLAYRDTKLTRIALGLFFLAVVGYGYFELRGLLWGPTITLSELPDVTSEQLVTIAGAAAHIATLSMNGTEIPVTETGEFVHSYLLAPGVNRIALDAKDKYGAAAHKTVEIVYDPPSAPVPAASSTPDASLSASSTPTSTESRIINSDAPLTR